MDPNHDGSISERDQHGGIRRHANRAPSPFRLLKPHILNEMQEAGASRSIGYSIARRIESRAFSGAFMTLMTPIRKP